MKLSKLFKKVFQSEGKNSCVSQKIIALKSSKEFNYLVDISRA